MRIIRLLVLLSVGLLAAAAVFGAPYTFVTYNLGLLRSFGSDLVPAVQARTSAAPEALADFAVRVDPQVMLLEEVWEDSAARAISGMLEPLGYTAVRPDVHTVIGLTSGLLLLVKEPLRVTEWKFTRFSRTTFVDSFAFKGVLEAVMEDGAGGARFALVGTHTVAVDTVNGIPKDRGQLDAILAQADQVRDAVSRRSRGGSVPVVLLGDFNVGPGYVEAAWQRFSGLDGLRETAEEAEGGPSLITWDPSNPLVKFGGYPGEPASRIDHVLVLDGGTLHWTVRAARVLMQEPVPGLVLKPKGSGGAVEIPLSDHYAYAAETDLSPR